MIDGAIVPKEQRAVNYNLMNDFYCDLGTIYSITSTVWEFIGIGSLRVIISLVRYRLVFSNRKRLGVVVRRETK